MPIYEYECETCIHPFEYLMMGSGRTKPSCPKCGSEQVKQQMSRTVIVSAQGGSDCVPGSSGGFS